MDTSKTAETQSADMQSLYTPTKTPEGETYGNQAFVVKWTLFTIAAQVLVFMARLIDNPENPFGIHYPPAALLAGIVSIFVLMFGIYTITSNNAKTQTMTRRKGVLTIIIGASMLVSFFLFKEALSLVL